MTDPTVEAPWLRARVRELEAAAEGQRCALEACQREREAIATDRDEIAEENDDLRVKYAALQFAYSTLSSEMDGLHKQHVKLRTAAIDLTTHLAVMGAVVANDDVARLLERMLLGDARN